MPALVRRKAVCPCGLRISSVVLAEGQEVQPLACTLECKKQERRARLADAFGVGPPEHYVPVQVSTTGLTLGLGLALGLGLGLGHHSYGRWPFSGIESIPFHELSLAVVTE